MSEAPTLYEWAGGREAIERMIGCFYDRVERDDLLSPLFPGGVSAAHRAALVGYLEWGTRLAMHNSQPGADVVQQAPVPRWGWGVAPPYQP
jgi:truncated hemoglobin YjbI